MDRLGCCLLYLFLLELTLAVVSLAAVIARDDFPPGFIFGAGTSAYQVEGAVAEDGREPSIWDTFANAGLNLDKSTGDIASDQYHKYKVDVKLMYEMGLDAYRFSISWSRLIPDGRGSVNPKGLQYYNNLIDELVRYGIQPHVTLCHFDLPQALQDEYRGALSPRLADDFTAYASVCFKEFGDRVKHWITFNEPNFEPILGYDLGIFPPARCSFSYAPGINCSEGDSTREPYLSAHNILLSHASAVSMYKDKYQRVQGGKIGITLLGFWFQPSSDLEEDVAATQRVKDFHLGWFLEPLVYGDYPAVMKEIVGSRLPFFDADESMKLKQSFDFIGLNHYSEFYVRSYPNNLDENQRDYLKDVSAMLLGSSRTKLALVDVFDIRSTPPPFPTAPWALQEMLEYVKVKYGNPPIMIHENGYAEYISASPGNGTNDDYRVEFLQAYIEGLLQSVRNGSNTHGYFVWSFLDCFELMFGYTSRYGLYGVDFSREDRRRYPRRSAQWYTDFLRIRGLNSLVSNAIYTE